MPGIKDMRCFVRGTTVVMDQRGKQPIHQTTYYSRSQRNERITTGRSDGSPIDADSPLPYTYVLVSVSISESTARSRHGDWRMQVERACMCSEVNTALFDDLK